MEADIWRLRFMSGREIKVIGVGPGNIDLLTPAAKRAVESCDVLVGGKRNLEIFSYFSKEKIALDTDFTTICTYISENAGKKDIAILASGDPGIFSIADYLKQKLPDIEIQTIPGISSLQYLCSYMSTTWDDMGIISLHGRDAPNLFSLVSSKKKTAIFTGGSATPDYVCRLLIQEGFSNMKVTVGERLSYDDENITIGTIDEIAQMEFDDLSLMIVEQEGKNICEYETLWQYETPGIPDNMFIRGNVPMTKEEVRAAAISKLRLEKDSIVFDIGAGTGSISVECGLICHGGRVYAVEMNENAIELIWKNIAKFNLDNVTIIKGKAPESLENLPTPDRIFIGGTGGYMDEILDWISKKPKRNDNKISDRIIEESYDENNDKVSHENRIGTSSEIENKIRVVVNAISPETVYEALKGFERRGFGNIEIVNISASRGVKAGDKHIMKALNPIYIISAECEGVFS